ncbi:MAG: hypothetical protein LBL87_04360 [Ruminococcus sp.]|nr:hypothetical protein [Ruminococcus sp.]
MLKKIIKYDFKSQCVQFGILYAAAIILPILVYGATVSAENWVRETVRVLIGGLGFAAIPLLTFIWSVKIFDNEFNGKGSYLVQMLPVKIKHLIFSKALLFFIWSILSSVIALTYICLIDMNFSTFEDIYDFVVRNWNELQNTNEYIVVFVLGFRILLSIVSIFGFVCATEAFGHLFGTKKSRYEALFVIVFFFIANIYMTLSGNINTSIDINGETVGFVSSIAPSMISVMFYIDTAIAIAVTAGFFYFTNWVYTKKLNVI